MPKERLKTAERLRKVGEVGLKEILFPVIVLDDDCKTCEELDIVSSCERLYAGEQCISQDTQVRCRNVYKCMKMLKMLKKHADGERRETQ